MDQGTTSGPRLSDQAFFAQAVDLDRPELAEVARAVDGEDWAAARRLFSQAARQALQPQRFLRIPRTFRGRNFMYPDETAAQAAERILAGELISCGTPHRFEGEVDWFINPTFNQYREWTWQLSRHSEWGILAERYRETGDERYAERFVRFFQSWVRQAVVPEDAPGGATLCWRTIEAGIRMGGVWQWALHTFYRSPHFTDDVLIDWYKSVWEHGWRLRHFHRTGNWLIMEMNGLAQVAVLYPQFRHAPAWKAYALERLIEELDAQVYADGFQVELSTGYHQVDVHNYQWLIDVLEAYDEPVPLAFRSNMERMHAVNVMMMMPDGRLPDVNDGRMAPVAQLMDRAVEAYPERRDFLWTYTEGRDGAPPAETSVAFPYAGYIVSRSSWDRDAMWALFDGGPFGYGHQHEDKLNLLLHAYGRMLLIEGGNYAYDDSEMRRYVLSTRSHNTIRVDGQDQNRRLGYQREAFDVTAPAGASWSFGDEVDVVEALYDEGYGPQADRVVSHHRRVIALKRPLEGLGLCLVVVDRLVPADGRAHTYQALWHLGADRVEEEGTAVRTVDAGAPSLTVLSSSAPGLRVRVVRGQGAPEWQGWKTTEDHQQGQYAPSPVALVEWTTAGPARLVTLLYPTPPGERCPVSAVIAPTDVSSTVIRLALADGREVEIAQDAAPVA